MEAPAAESPAAADRHPLHRVRLSLGLAIGVLAIAPVWRLLARPATGLAGAATVDMTAAYTAFIWAGAALLAIPAILCARAFDAGTVDRTAARIARLLTAPATLAFATFCAALAFIVAAGFGRFALAGQPNLVDAMSQLLQARLLAAGSLAATGNAFGEFWMPLQSVFTSNGWVSQYPPGHVVMLALGMKAGAVWAVGPAMLALTVFFTTLAAERLLPGRKAVARAGALLVAVSPFMIAHAGAYMNHTTAAAFGAVAVWCAARAIGGGIGWTVAAGAAAGAMFTVRPLSALTLAAVVTVWVAGMALRQSGRVSTAAVRLAAMVAGALPFGLLIAAYNTHFFGSPTTFGYGAALGPAGGLGFGLDPWGNTYGPVEAIAYTSSELSALSLFLIETPLPLVTMIAAWFALTPRLEPGERLLAGWAFAPLAAQSVYWHHGLFMGPRMLNESAPAWCLLAVVAVTWIVSRLPDRIAMLGSYSPRVFGATMAAGGMVAAILALAPMRLMTYSQRPEAPALAFAAPAPALVFVHGGWTSRLSARLAASGMRLDSVESALRQNPTCAVQEWVDARENGAGLPTLDFERRATDLPQAVEISPGNRIRIEAGERLAGECARQAGADRLGTIDVTPLLWLGELPATPAGSVAFARDMGPAANARLIAASPGRTAWVLATNGPGSAPGLFRYEDAMRALWGVPEGS